MSVKPLNDAAARPLPARRQVHKIGSYDGVRRRDTLPAATDVCVALGKIAAWPDVAVPALRAMLSDKELLHWPMRRAAVAAALSDFGPAARAAIPDLKSALQDDALSVQQAAAAALAQIEEGEAPP